MVVLKKKNKYKRNKNHIFHYANERARYKSISQQSNSSATQKKKKKIVAVHHYSHSTDNCKPAQESSQVKSFFFFFLIRPQYTYNKSLNAHTTHFLLVICLYVHLYIRIHAKSTLPSLFRAAANNRKRIRCETTQFLLHISSRVCERVHALTSQSRTNWPRSIYERQERKRNELTNIVRTFGSDQQSLFDNVVRTLLARFLLVLTSVYIYMFEYA